MRKNNRIAINDIYIDELLNDDRYQVRADGRIFVLRGEVWRETGLAKTSKRGKQYLHLMYGKKNLKVHRIVYRAYVGKLDQTLLVNHKDNDSLNNNPSNLELLTVQENTVHGLSA